MLEVFEKTVLQWTCPKCDHNNEITEQSHKVVPDELECEKCDYTDQWELCE